MPRTTKMAHLTFTKPMECLPVKRLPGGPEWVYELKLDGYRTQAICEVEGVRLLSRNGKDLTKRFPGVAAALADALHIGTVVDGELVALDSNGSPSFNALQNARADSPIVFYAFDILTNRGEDVKALPLSDRLSILGSAFVPSEQTLLCENFPGPVARFVDSVRKVGGEGVVGKRLDRRYESGKRSGAWVKMRLNQGQEFVIGGFTPGATVFDSLVIGVYEGRRLRYVARVRAGFVPASRRDIYAELKPLITTVCPFANLPEAKSGRWGEGLTAEKMRNCIWVRPELVARFDFLEWTDSNHVRHIKFIAMRDDKDPRKVVREE
jgi:bifunctional non-homologous end joining protein LigD